MYRLLISPHAANLRSAPPNQPNDTHKASAGKVQSDGVVALAGCGKAITMWYILSCASIIIWYCRINYGRLCLEWPYLLASRPKESEFTPSCRECTGYFGGTIICVRISFKNKPLLDNSTDTSIKVYSSRIDSISIIY